MRKEEAQAHLLVLMQLLSISGKLREAAIKKDLVQDFFQMLPGVVLVSSAEDSPAFLKQLQSSAFYLCHFSNMEAENKTASATHRQHLHHLQMTSSTRQHQIMIEQQQQ